MGFAHTSPFLELTKKKNKLTFFFEHVCQRSNYIVNNIEGKITECWLVNEEGIFS